MSSMSQQQPQEDDEYRAEHLEEGIPPKPKRPLTVFNLFGKLERNYIVQSSQKQAGSVPDPSDGTTSEASDGSTLRIDPYLKLRPAKYRDIIMPPDWFKVGKNKTKRQYYQCHGVIEFEQLSKVVAERWNNIDDETRKFCRAIYETELIEYRKEIAAYTKKYGKDAIDAQKSTYSKRKRQEDDNTSTSGEAITTYAGDSSFTEQAQLAATSNVNQRTRVDSGLLPHANLSIASNDNAAANHLSQLHNAYIASLHTAPSSDIFGNAAFNPPNSADPSPSVQHPSGNAGMMLPYRNPNAGSVQNSGQASYHPGSSSKATLPYSGTQTPSINSYSMRSNLTSGIHLNQIYDMDGPIRNRSENYPMATASLLGAGTQSQVDSFYSTKFHSAAAGFQPNEMYNIDPERNRNENSAMSISDPRDIGRRDIGLEHMPFSSCSSQAGVAQGGLLKNAMVISDTPKLFSVMAEPCYLTGNDLNMHFNRRVDGSQFEQPYHYGVGFETNVQFKPHQPQNQRPSQGDQSATAGGNQQFAFPGQIFKTQSDSSSVRRQGSYIIEPFQSQFVNSAAAQHTFQQSQGYTQPVFEQPPLTDQAHNQMTGNDIKPASGSMRHHRHSSNQAPEYQQQVFQASANKPSRANRTNNAQGNKAEANRNNSDGSGNSGSRLSDYSFDDQLALVGNDKDIILCGADLKDTFDS